MRPAKNIYCASNPAKLCDALRAVFADSDFSDDIVFLPSRRAVRSVEKMMVARTNAAVLLPKLVALGESAGEEDESSEEQPVDVVSNLEREIVLAKLLTAQMNVGMSGALPVAKDLVRMMDYIENERRGDGLREIDWPSLVGAQYAGHFQEKAKFLDLAVRALPLLFAGRETIAQKRNRDIREWIEVIKNKEKGKVIVCGSTASVPATADLMECVAGLARGHIILPGKINQESGTRNQESAVSNPYYSELKFLERIGVALEDVCMIDVGESSIDFFNNAFNNKTNNSTDSRCSFPVRIDCDRESEEAEVVAEIAAEKSGQGKSVLIVSPDVSAAQRLCESLARRGAAFDFSGGTKGSATPLGRFILNSLEKQGAEIYAEYKKTNNLFKAAANAADAAITDGRQSLRELASIESAAVWDAMKEVSDILASGVLGLSQADLRAILAQALGGVSVRPPMGKDCLISVVGTIESRMQSADIVILTGLNEGMFPAPGYENPWLPRRVADALGLPPPERKVSLMAMDFINLSCGPQVYWTRSKMSGGGETTESRFLSRVAVACKGVCDTPLHDGDYWLGRVRALDDVPYSPLDDSAPKPKAVNDDVYVTELELLIHNPYAFYARHILRLYPKDDPEREPDARDFGILVHGVIEELAKSKEQRADEIVKMLDEKAREVLPAGSVLYHFWHKRFLDIAPAIADLLTECGSAEIEVPMGATIAGRNVRARADMVCGDIVMDIKTGAAPNRKQLEEGNMPQLPLEAHMLLRNKEQILSGIIIRFLQLKNRDVRRIEYSGAQAQQMMDAAVAKTTALFNQYGRDFEPYEYRETGEEKYKIYDDLARV